MERRCKLTRKRHKDADHNLALFGSKSYYPSRIPPFSKYASWPAEHLGLIRWPFLAVLQCLSLRFAQLIQSNCSVIKWSKVLRMSASIILLCGLVWKVKSEITLPFANRFLSCTPLDQQGSERLKLLIQKSPRFLACDEPQCYFRTAVSHVPSKCCATTSLSYRSLHIIRASIPLVPCRRRGPDHVRDHV